MPGTEISPCRSSVSQRQQHTLDGQRSLAMWRGSAAGLIETLHCVNMGEVKADAGPPSNSPGKLGEHTLDVSEEERCAWGTEGFTGQDT